MVTWPPEAVDEAVALGRAQDAEGGEGGGRVGGGGGGGEDERPGPVDEQVDEAAGAGHEPAHGAERLRQGAHPQVLDAAEVGVGAEHGVGLVEDEQGAVVGAQPGQLVDRRGVAVHGEDGVGDDDGRAGRRAGAAASRSARWDRSAWS